MKKLALSFVMLLVTITLFTCENEPLEGFDLEGDNPFNTNNLIGTWTLAEFDLTVNSTTVVGGMSIESITVIESFNENYDVTFNPSTFTTNGSYSYDVDIVVNGQANSQSLSVQNVNGVGNYTTNGSEITSDASFVSFEFQGMDLSEFQGEQTTPYTISPDGQTLTFTQNTTETNNEGGASSTSIVSSISVWTKVDGGTDPCVEATNFTSSAETAYNNDSTNEDLCNAYTSALQNQINACGDTDGSLQAIIDGLGDCSNTTTDVILLKKVVQTYSATDSYTSEFTYEGNKVKTVVFTLVDDGVTNTETETYTYENEKLMRVDYEFNNSTDNYEEFEYNSSDQLVNTVLYNPSLNEGQKWEYTYNTDGTIVVKNYTGDLISQTNLFEEYTLTFQNGNLALETFVNSSNSYSYDNMNGYFKNIHQREMFNLHFVGGTDFNNPVSEQYTDGAGNSETEITTYVYNADNYPESSTTAIDGVTDYTSVYTYY